MGVAGPSQAPVGVAFRSTWLLRRGHVRSAGPWRSACGVSARRRGGVEAPSAGPSGERKEVLQPAQRVVDGRDVAQGDRRGDAGHRGDSGAVSCVGEEVRVARAP